MKNEILEVTGTGKLKYIFKGIFFAFLFMIVLSLIYSLILAYTYVSDSTIPLVVNAITVGSIFISTVLYSKKIGISGLKNGLAISVIYVLLIYILSSAFSVGFSINNNTIIIMLITIFFGAIGGIIGVNLNRYQR